MEQAYPLQWPQGRSRTPRHKVTYSRFDVTPSKAQSEMLGEIQRMGGRNIVVSTDRRVKRDGTLYARDLQSTPDDAGVAVYFERKGQRVCFCCDRYGKIWENMRAIGKTIEAMRGIERWGSAEMLDQAFTGFTALPPADEKRPWWVVLGVSESASAKEANDAWRAKCKDASEAELYELNAAREESRNTIQIGRG